MIIEVRQRRDIIVVTRMNGRGECTRRTHTDVSVASSKRMRRACERARGCMRLVRGGLVWRRIVSR